MTAIAGRDDVLKLQTFAQSDLAPFLWRVLGADGERRNRALHRMAEEMLQKLNPGVKVDFQQAGGRTRRDRAHVLRPHRALRGDTDEPGWLARDGADLGMGREDADNVLKIDDVPDWTGRGVLRASLRPLGAGAEAGLRTGAGGDTRARGRDAPWSGRGSATSRPRNRRRSSFCPTRRRHAGRPPKLRE